MPQFLVAIHHPDNYDPSRENESMMRDIHVLNEEMIAAGSHRNKFPFHVDSLQCRSTILQLQQNTN